MMVLGATTATATLTHLTCEAAVGLLKGCARLVSTSNRTNAHPSTEQVRTVLEDTDIVSRIKIVQAYLTEVKASRWLRERKSIRLATEGVKHVIDKLQASVDAIHAELEAHAERYFAYWRTPDVGPHVGALTVWSVRLDERMRTLREVTTLASVSQPRKED
jgi:hypothetical protein